MSWDTFLVVKDNGPAPCVHSKEEGCHLKIYKCQLCGVEINHQCGNNALIGWHACQQQEEEDGTEVQ